jgi:DNA-binding SARP family transcriptional activator
MTRIYLTGRIALEHEGRLVVDEPSLPGRQGRLLFAYLATHLHDPVPRGELVDLLWGDDQPVEAPAALSVLLSRLRSVLRKALPGADVGVEPGSLALRIPPPLWIDVEAAANAVDEAEGAVRRGDTRAAWGHANVAAVIGGRTFMAGEEAPWIEAQRRRLSSILVRALECLTAASASHGELTAAIHHAEQIVAADPLRESAYLRLMQLHVQTGNAAAALRVFADCRERLRDDLGASPSSQLEQLHLSILRNEPLPGR